MTIERTAEVTEGGLLGGRLRYRQFSAGHRSGFEPVLLAASVAAKPGDLVLEAGTGAGAALLCLGNRVPTATGTGVEITPALADLANENFKINGLAAYSCICSDIAAAGFNAVFDHVIANPPWHGASSTRSPDAGRALAHHSQPNLLADWIAGMTRCLKPRGRMSLILPAAQFGTATTCLRQTNYQGIRLFPLWPRVGQPAKLVIIAARLGSGEPDQVMTGLVLHDEAGITKAAQAILRDGAATALAG